MKTKAARVPSLQPRLRVMIAREIALGPGKVELLEAIHATGSITKAAEQMGMSYMRAWTLIRTMNRCFKEPLVSAVRGGSKGGGGAELTLTGRQALSLYQKINAKFFAAARSDWARLQKLLRR
jgi:molybdate transport system regulatory protein